MPRPIGLHQLSAMDLSPLDLIDVAAQCGYGQVSLFTNAPVVPIEGQEGKFAFPTVTPAMAGEVQARLAAHGLDVVNAEFFLMRPDVDLETYRPGLALGRELGAKNAMTHIFEPDLARATEILGRFCRIAAQEDMRVSIEFCQMTPGCKTIHAARAFVDAVGAPNLGFGICPMHLVRSGGSAADIAALDPAILYYGQINDGHGLHVAEAYFDEVHDRQLPGEGDFPLQQILSALPADAPIEFKCPSDSRRKAGVSALDWAREGYARSQALLDRLPAAD
ncbi:MAG: sugar phosphate isomerase/epimerase family protein [Novosphingobium sp.]